MTDENVHIQPAIPSRANPPPPVPAPIERHPNGDRVHRNAAGDVIPKKKRPAKKKAKVLSSAEIRKINAKRAAALKAKKPARKKAKKQKTRTIRQIIQAAPRETGRAKNPNRPLEMKNQMSAMLEAVCTLQKAELMLFSRTMPSMQALSRAGRKQVIAALQQVYG